MTARARERERTSPKRQLHMYEATTTKIVDAKILSVFSVLSSSWSSLEGFIVAVFVSISASLSRSLLRVIKPLKPPLYAVFLSLLNSIYMRIYFISSWKYETKRLREEKNNKIPASNNKNMAKWKVFAFNYWKKKRASEMVQWNKKFEKSRLRSIQVHQVGEKRNQKRDILGWKTRKNSWFGKNGGEEE